MSEYVLIDSPICLFSPLEKVERWIERCQEEINANPGSAQWIEALIDAESIRKTIEQDAV